ncbi:MAG: 30S ribosomal protein S16 [Prevotellaceae bacterium]|jgi:small subunit ribosomal protein S16|nr:30S ribosomal protein S16 [Prevotellaceae bacterium]
MSVKIRLARHGKKGHAYFHIVVADSHAPRDGRFIERIGTYDPNTNPATIDIDGDKALDWMSKGAQPTDTCRRILSYKGVLLKKHLLEGVKKGALTEEAANAKWEAWMQEKERQVQAKRDELSQSSRNAVKARLESEAKVKEAKAAVLAQKKSELALKEAEAKAARAAAEAAEEVVPEAPAPEVAAPEAAAPAPEAPAPVAAEPAPETPPAEAPAAE